jgi:hypothetical protein
MLHTFLKSYGNDIDKGDRKYRLNKDEDYHILNLIINLIKIDTLQHLNTFNKPDGLVTSFTAYLKTILRKFGGIYKNCEVICESNDNGIYFGTLVPEKDIADDIKQAIYSRTDIKIDDRKTNRPPFKITTIHSDFKEIDIQTKKIKVYKFGYKPLYRLPGESYTVMITKANHAHNDAILNILIEAANSILPNPDESNFNDENRSKVIDHMSAKIKKKYSNGIDYNKAFKDIYIDARNFGIDFCQQKRYDLFENFNLTENIFADDETKYFEMLGIFNSDIDLHDEENLNMKINSGKYIVDTLKQVMVEDYIQYYNKIISPEIKYPKAGQIYIEIEHITLHTQKRGSIQLDPCIDDPSICHVKKLNLSPDPSDLKLNSEYNFAIDLIQTCDEKIVPLLTSRSGGNSNTARSYNAFEILLNIIFSGINLSGVNSDEIIQRLQEHVETNSLIDKYIQENESKLDIPNFSQFEKKMNEFEKSIRMVKESQEHKKNFHRNLEKDEKELIERTSVELTEEVQQEIIKLNSSILNLKDKIGRTQDNILKQNSKVLDLFKLLKHEIRVRTKIKILNENKKENDLFVSKSKEFNTEIIQSANDIFSKDFSHFGNDIFNLVYCIHYSSFRVNVSERAVDLNTKLEKIIGDMSPRYDQSLSHFNHLHLKNEYFYEKVQSAEIPIEQKQKNEILLNIFIIWFNLAIQKSFIYEKNNNCIENNYTNSLTGDIIDGSNIDKYITHKFESSCINLRPVDHSDDGDISYRKYLLSPSIIFGIDIIILLKLFAPEVESINEDSDICSTFYRLFGFQASIIKSQYSIHNIYIKLLSQNYIKKLFGIKVIKIDETSVRKGGNRLIKKRKLSKINKKNKKTHRISLKKNAFVKNKSINKNNKCLNTSRNKSVKKNNNKMKRFSRKLL